LRRFFAILVFSILATTIILNSQNIQLASSYREPLVENNLQSKPIYIEGNNVNLRYLNDTADIYELHYIFTIHKAGDLILAQSAYTSQDIGYTTLLNATDIRHITLIKSITGRPGAPAVGSCSATYMEGNVIFLSMTPFFGTATDIPWFLLIYNVSDPENPVLLSNTSMPDEIRDFKLLENNLLVLSDRYLTILDVSNLSNPNFISQISLNYDLGQQLGSRLKTLIIDKNYTYIVTRVGDLIIFDITNVSNPELIVSTHLPSLGYDAIVANDLLFVAGGLGGLYIYDLSNKSSPSLISRYNKTLRCSMSLDLLDLNTLVIADNVYGLHVLNISDLQNIHELSNATSYDRLMDVLIDENLIFGADMLAGIHVYNASDKTNVTSIAYSPVVRDSWQNTPTISAGVREKGEYDVEYIEGLFGVGMQTLVSRENKSFFVNVPIQFDLSQVVVYNDTDGDGKFSYYFETYPDNPFLITRRVFTDQVYFAASFFDVHVKISSLENETWHGHEAYFCTIEISGLNFTRGIPYSFFYGGEINESLLIGNSAKGNITFTMHFIPFENTNTSSPFLYDNLTIKIDIDLTLYDVDWGIVPDKYCIALGFNSRIVNDLVYYPVNALFTSRGSSVKAMDVISSFFINENYTAINGSYSHTGKVNVSFDISWEDFHPNFELANRHIVLANFVEIPGNTTEIHYDPQLGFYTKGTHTEISTSFYFPPTRPGEEQQPEQQPEGPPRGFEISSTVAFLVGVATIFVILAVVKLSKRHG